MYVILLLILCKVESSIERKGEFTEKEEHLVLYIALLKIQI